MNPHLIIYERKGDYAAIPWAIRLASGRILLAFRLGTIHQIEREGRVVVCWSDDEGETWSRPQVVCDHPGMDDREPAMAEWNGEVWMSVMGQNEDRDLYTTYLLRSHDQGRTWTAPEQFRYQDCGFMLRCPVAGEPYLWCGHVGLKGPRALIKLEPSPAGWRWDLRAFPEMAGSNEWMAAAAPGGIYMMAREQKAGEDSFYSAWYRQGLEEGAVWPVKSIWHSDAASRPFVIYHCEPEGGGYILAVWDERAGRRIVAQRLRFEEGRLHGIIGWKPEDPRVPVLQDSDYLRGTDFGYGSAVHIGGRKWLVVYWAYTPLGEKERGIYGSYVEV